MPEIIIEIQVNTEEISECRIAYQVTQTVVEAKSERKIQRIDLKDTKIIRIFNFS